MSKEIDKLRAVYGTKVIEKKDFSLGDAFKTATKAAKKFVQDDGSLIFPVIGIASKYVPKYDKGTNRGYHTMLYLENGMRTGGFSNSLLSFAEFMYGAAQVQLVEYTRIDLNKPLLLKVSQENFSTPDENGEMIAKTTYNFEIVGGEAEKFKTITDVSGYHNLLAAESAIPEDYPDTDCPAE